MQKVQNSAEMAQNPAIYFGGLNSCFQIEDYRVFQTDIRDDLLKQSLY